MPTNERQIKVIKKDERKDLPDNETIQRQEDSLLKLLMRKNPEKAVKFFFELKLSCVLQKDNINF